MPRRTPNLPKIRASLAHLDAIVREHPKLKTEASQARLADRLASLEEEETMARPPKDEEDRKGIQIALRLTSAEVARIDAVAAAMAQGTALEVTRAATMRAAISAGLDALEERFGLAKRKRPARGSKR